MSEEKRMEWRKEWEEAEQRVKAKPKQLRTDKRSPRQVAVKPMFNQEHCDNCQVMLPRGHVQVVQVEANGRFPSAYKFLCPACRAEAVRAEK